MTLQLQGHIFFIIECPGTRKFVQKKILFFVILTVAFLGNICYNIDSEREVNGNEKVYD